MKHLIQFVLGALLVCAAVLALTAGCATMRHALYDERTLSWTNSDGVARSYVEVTPKAAVTDAISSAGGALGPYGVAGAGLTLSILSLVAHALTRRAQRASPAKLSRGDGGKGPAAPG